MMFSNFIENLALEMMEIIKLVTIYICVLNGSTKKVKKNWMIAIIIFISFIIFRTFYSDDVLFRTIFRVIICSLITNEYIYERILGVYISIIFVSVIDAIPSNIYSIVSEKLQVFSIQAQILLTLCYIFIGLIIISIHSKENKHYILRKHSLQLTMLFTILFLCSILSIGGVEYLALYHMTQRNQIIISIGIIVTNLILLFVILVLIITQNSRDDYKELAATKDKYLRMNYQYYQKQQKYYEEISRFKHDTRRHLSCIQNLCDNDDLDKVKKYIQNMTQELDAVPKLTDCGNDVLNALINTIHELSTNNHIKFVCQGHVHVSEKISEMDLCTIFSNLLENAYEACIKKEDERYIHISLKQLEEKICVEIINSINKNNDVPQKHFFISKKGRGHGFGIRNVERVIDKYSGMISYQQNNDIFSVTVII